jgi:multidrug resistance efflux pump
VTRFNAVLGSRAEPEMVLYEIADLSSVWVVASVHERDLNAMRVGMTARFTATNTPQSR